MIRYPFGVLVIVPALTILVSTWKSEAAIRAIAECFSSKVFVFGFLKGPEPTMS